MSKKRKAKREERRPIDVDFKLHTLAKLDSKCPCCNGKFAYSQMTNEHIIPLAKGGTNDSSNLTLLCEDCNRAKGDLIVHQDWYKHAPKDVKQNIKNVLDDYIKDYAWLTSNSFLPYDLMPIKYKMMLPNGRSQVSQCEWLHKAVYDEYHTSDFDRIYEFAEKYNTKFDIDCHGDDLKECIRERFDSGAMYYSENKSGEMTSLFTIGFTETMIHRKQRWSITMDNPMCRYDNYQSASFAYAVFEVVRENIVQELYKNNLNMMPMDIVIYNPNSKMAELFDVQFSGHAGRLGQSVGTITSEGYYRCGIMTHNIHDSNGNNLSDKDLDLLESHELDKCDKFVQRLKYKEDFIEDIVNNNDNAQSRKVSRSKKRQSNADEVSKKGMKLKYRRSHDKFDEFDGYDDY